MKKTFLVLLFLVSTFTQLYCQCVTPQVIIGGGQTPSTVFIQCNSNGATTLLFYVEYGLSGFTPGTGASAGVGGTIFTTTSTTTQTITGLTPNSDYDFYIRQTCTGGVFSANAAVKRTVTPPDCATAPVISCGVMQSVSFPATNYWGVWAGCSSNDWLGREKIYRLTPTQTGMHVLFTPPPAVPNNVYYSYKSLSAGCTSSGWTCIGQRNNSQVSQISFGPLTAGVTYLIMVSPNNTASTTTGDFRIECPLCITSTATSDLIDRSPTTITLHTNSSLAIVEYGPQGFIPGAGAAAGTNGTVVSVVGFDKVVTGLTPATPYDFYVRTNCAPGWGPNSLRVFNATNQCPDVATYGALGSTTTFDMSGPHGFFGNYQACASLSTGYGDEAILKFTAPATAVYNVMLSDYVTNALTTTFVNFGTRVTNNTCGPVGFACQLPQSFSGSTYTYTLNASSSQTYDLLFDVVDSFSAGNIDVLINCSEAKNITATTITSTSAIVNFSSSNTTYLEYGTVGFTPGTGASAGGGTLLSSVTSPVSLTSLLSFTNYIVYIRTKCGNDFSANQQVTFKTLHNCGNEPLLTCGTNFNVNMFNNTGQWTGYNCGTGSTNSTEFLYRFTPTQTGTYTITNVSSIGFGSTPLNVYYKTQGGTCDVTGWTCVGTFTSSPQTLSWGPLSAGITYLLLFDGQYNNCTKTLRVECFSPCAATVTPSGTVNFCAGSSLTLSANTGTGISYQWYKNGVAQAGATSSSYLIGNAGTYYVVENSSCGTATSNSVVVNQINNPNPTFTYSTPTTFCSPGSITFTANTFTGVTYQWQKNSIDIAGATAQTYTATTNGKYRVKQTANGCTKQGQDVQVTTATSVTAAITANGPITFCTGGSVILSVGNAVPGYSFQWKNNNVNIGGATTNSYTATAAGSYTCTVSASCGNATSNAIVVSTGGIVALVNPSGTVNICTGATVAMSANTGTGFAWQWKKNGTNITGATASTYNATTAGAYTVAITSPCGNATSAATTVNITILAASITPTGTTTICNGQAATFTANTGYNYTYQWYRAGIALAGATASTHANSTAGNYTVKITQGGVCSATSNIAALTVISNPNPTVTLSGPTTFCAGQSVTITANTFAGVTYQWIKGSTNIAGATNQTYTATTAGQYNVKETASGCTKQMGVPIVVTVNCREASYAVNSDEAIKVVPNPFSNVLTVSGLEFNIGNGIKMLNVLGEIVLSETVRTTTPNLNLQTSNLPAGVYFLQVTTSFEKKTMKVVKQ